MKKPGASVECFSKREYLFAIFICILVVYLAFFNEWSSGRSSIDAPAGRVLANTKPPKVPTPVKTEITNEDRINKLYSDLKSRINYELFADYLENSNENINAYLAVYDLTSDQKGLAELLRIAGRDERVLLRDMLASTSESEKLAKAKEVIKAYPTNVIANYLVAKNAIKNSDRIALKEALEAALKQSAPRFEDKNGVVHKREALRSVDINGLNASLLAGVGSHYTDESQTLMLSVGDELYTFATSGAEGHELLAYGVAWSEHVRAMDGNTSVGMLVANKYEVKFLEQLDPETEYGADGLLVKDRLTELQNQKDQIKAVINEANDLIANLSEKQLETYLDDKAINGEYVATRRLLEK